ncbi:MAG: PGF-pre-PGF domain-containing protein, partial [Halapricum sp.]
RRAAAAFERWTDTVPAGYVAVNHTFGSAISTAIFEFSIRKSYLESIGVEASAVTLYRQNASGWHSLPTTVVGDNETHVRFEGVSPGFSVFALGTGQPKFVVTDPSLADSTVSPGAPAQVSATVRNHGVTAGETTVELSAGKTVVASKQIEVAAGSTERVTFEFEQDLGNWELEINGETFATLAVEQRETQTPTTARPDTTQTPTTMEGGDDDSSGIAWILAVIFVIGGILAVFALARNRDTSSDEHANTQDESSENANTRDTSSEDTNTQNESTEEDHRNS